MQRELTPEVHRRPLAPRNGVAGSALALAIALGCAQSAAHWVPGTPWDAPLRPAVVAQEAAIILRDGTDLRLLTPSFDDGSVRGARVTACTGRGCEMIRRTLTVQRSEVAWMSLRYASDEEERAALRAASRPPTGGAIAPDISPFSTEAETLRSDAPRARHAVYLSGTIGIISGGVGVNYSYRPIRVFAVSVGGGMSFACGGFFFACGSNSSAAGAQAMAHLLLGGATENLELGLGLAVVDTNSQLLYGSIEQGVAAYPSAFAGVRVHPVNGGFLLRVGLAWELGLAFGLNASLGAAF